MTAFKDLEALNVEICRATGAGHGQATTPEASAAYHVELARRAVEVRTAIDAAKRENVGRDHRHYILGIEGALIRALMT